jgi:hypothetical protein
MRTSSLLAWVIVILLQSGAAFGAGAKDELETLAAHEAWLELSMKLESVPAPARDAAWQALAERAAIGVLASLEGRGEAFGGAMMAEAFLTRFPTLKESRVFMKKRAELRRSLFTGAAQPR